jgi:peroxiredoxin
MNSPALRFGIPDVELRCASGITVNPSSFAGHELIVLFCPADPAEAARELGSYRSRSADFVDEDAWVVAISEECAQIAAKGPERILTVRDPERSAWDAFRSLTDSPDRFDRHSGATFVFTRGGNLHRFWLGTGHVGDVLAELQNSSG